MAETIISINEYVSQDGTSPWRSDEGYTIQTNEQVITLAIDMEPDCCEAPGYFLTEDDTAKFIGATLLGVEITDTNRSGRVFESGYGHYDEQPDIYLDEGDVMFVDIKTDRGTLQFVAYNSHNGYYGHYAFVKSKQVEDGRTL